MSDAIIGALLLNFGAVVAANIARVGRQNCSPVTYELATPLTALGSLAAPAAIFLFARDQGIFLGLWNWAWSSLPLSLVAIFLMDGISSILGLGAIGVGGFFAVRSFF
ncbi:MAG TPA: hypothetical protein VN941_05610 [Bradyrhizobium sp.]|nr:hypothetical protein [Bradyrhizobium sp.]